MSMLELREHLETALRLYDGTSEDVFGTVSTSEGVAASFDTGFSK